MILSDDSELTCGDLHPRKLSETPKIAIYIIYIYIKGVTFSKAHHFGYPAVSSSGVAPCVAVHLWDLVIRSGLAKSVSHLRLSIVKKNDIYRPGELLTTVDGRKSG